MWKQNLLVSALAVLANAPAFSQGSDDPLPNYQPPSRGAPASRVGGGSRGAGDAAAEISVIAPDHTGLTLQEQPTLYWHLSTPVAAGVEITLIDDVAVKPLLELKFATGTARGLQEIRMSESGVRLKPDVEYRWHVALVLDPAQRSKDVIASGTIKRVVLPEDKRSRLAGISGPAAVSAYAAQGLWYDSIDALAALMRREPSNPALRRQYQSLLKQVGLEQVAASTQ